MPLTIQDYERRHHKATPGERYGGREHNERTRRYFELLGLRDNVLATTKRDDGTYGMNEELSSMYGDLLDEIDELGGIANPRQTEPPPLGTGRARGEGGQGLAFKDAASGRTVRAFTKADSFYTGEPLSVGRCLHSMLTGRRDDLSEPEMLAMHGSSDTGGGYILSPSLSGMLIDLARANAVAFKAGCQTYPMESGEVNIARVATDPTAYWRAETVAVTSSAPVFSRVTLRAKTLACIVPVSIELLEDAANASSIIEDTIARSMGAALDLAILEGNGAGSQPIGVRNSSGINTCTSVGTPTDWAEASAAIGKILVANYNGDLSELSWTMDPVLAETYDNLKEGTTNAPLEPTPWVRQVKRFITTTMPTTEGAGAEHSMLLGHFPSCLVGMRTNGINIRILESGSATDSASVTWNAADQLMKLVVAYLRADVALLQPAWFTALTGCTHA